jgi:hypothetical protein
VKTKNSHYDQQPRNQSGPRTPKLLRELARCLGEDDSHPTRQLPSTAVDSKPAVQPIKRQANGGAREAKGGG